MTNKEKDWIANRCVKAKEKEGIILISHIIKIVNDFNKNRTCENCKFLVDEPMSIGSSKICEKLLHGVASDFGCNKFEAKTVSTDTKGEEDDK